MKKKFSLLLVTVMAISMFLTACGYVNPDNVEYNGRLGKEYRAEMNSDVALTAFMASVYVSNGFELKDIEDEEVKESVTGLVASILTQTGLSIKIPDAAYNAIPGYLALVDECGTWNGEFYLSEKDKQAGHADYSVDIAGQTLTVNAVMDFDQRDVEIQMVYNVHSGKLTSIDFTPSYSLGEKMQKAGLNTIIAMSIVFVVLILISLIIYAFNIFPYLENKKKAKAAKKNDAASEVVTQIAAREEQQMDDTELIAVIAAAIAASEGTSTSDFVVRSINRR